MSSTRFTFDANAIAHTEVAGWQAYYRRDRLQLLRLIVQPAQTQFRIPFPKSVIAAYHITRASVAWVPTRHDPIRIQHHLRKFYTLARQSSGLDFDVAQVAALEMRYWDDHRRLVGQADKTPFIATMTALHAALFGLNEEQTREYAELRVEANNVLDTITGHTSPDPVRDWQRCEELLQRAYRSIQAEMAQ